MSILDSVEKAINPFLNMMVGFFNKDYLYYALFGLVILLFAVIGYIIYKVLT